MIYGTTMKPNIQHFKPLTDINGMNAISMTQYSMKQGLKNLERKVLMHSSLSSDSLMPERY
jgi:hypothetical protein